MEQYGDVCESCGSILKGVDLLNPKCAECSKTPIIKESDHYFFKLSKFSDKLKKWMKEDKTLQSEVKNWLKTWLDKGLEDWCISREDPYFGFEIPNSEKETGSKKYFYVWLDAPIGYISSTKNYCDNNKLDWKDYWYKGQVYHFIGKDIAYFHYLFWPAMLMGVGIPLPKLTSHGFITVNNEKMSKSRGTFFTAKDFLKLYPAESLRFYYASHLDRKIVDVDLNFEDFKAVINNVFMGNLGNFCYRVLTFAEKNYSQIKEVAKEEELQKQIFNLVEKTKGYYLNQNFKHVVKCILQIADLGNAYFQQSEVWKDKDNKENVAKVGFCVNIAKILSVLISPVLPEFHQKICKSLNVKSLGWDDLNFNFNGKISKVDFLVEKIEHLPESTRFPLNLVVGQIKEVKDHPNADSLYLMKVDLGSYGIKQVVAGLKKNLDVEELLERKAVFCVNMKSAKLRGELSEAMVLAADDHETVSLLDLEKTSLGEQATFEGLENSTSKITFDDFQKIIISVKDGNVYFENKKLKTTVEEVIVRGVKEGTRIY